MYVEKRIWNDSPSNAEFVDRLAALPLAGQPGTICDYSHSTDALGRGTEGVSASLPGKPRRRSSRCRPALHVLDRGPSGTFPPSDTVHSWEKRLPSCEELKRGKPPRRAREPVTELMLARAQMAMLFAFHIVFAVAGMGMPVLMVIAESAHRRTGKPVFLELARRWSRGTAVLFAVGAVSGTVLSFELGLLWPRFMAFSGGIIGIPFALNKVRSRAMASMGIALAIALAYYSVNATFLALGRGGFIPPIIAAWAANVLFAGGGIYLIRKTSA